MVSIKPNTSVAIVAMGESRNDYIKACAIVGGPRGIADQTWAINAMGGVIQCDRVIMMDDAAVMVDHEWSKEHWGSVDHAENYRSWLTATTVPIYSCRTRKEFPNIVPFPREEIVKELGYEYFNTTVPYAVALAMYEGIEEIQLYGCDYTYPDNHVAESGRACLEFWLATALCRGHRIKIAPSSSLMDTNVPKEQKRYGYAKMREGD